MPEPYQNCLPYEYGFGVDQDDPLQIDLGEAEQFIALLESLGVDLINLSCGSPYYNPHIQRPALFPLPMATCRRKTRCAGWRGK